jgi:hypothetical protein
MMEVGCRILVYGRDLSESGNHPTPTFDRLHPVARLAAASAS